MECLILFGKKNIKHDATDEQKNNFIREELKEK